MSIYKINDIFTEEELGSIHKVIDNTEVPEGPINDKGTGLDDVLGRLQIGNLSNFLLKNILDKATKIANDLSDVPLKLDHVLYTEYSNKYGNPNLPPHFDGDTNDLIINYQLSANTSWDLGLNTELYPLEDNSAVIFNANKDIHWRPRKRFEDGEYVKMIFFRFYNSEKISDYSHLNYLQDDDVFKEVREFMDSLNPYI